MFSEKSFQATEKKKGFPSREAFLIYTLPMPSEGFKPLARHGQGCDEIYFETKIKGVSVRHYIGITI
jgi:hypothetical protein